MDVELRRIRKDESVWGCDDPVRKVFGVYITDTNTRVGEVQLTYTLQSKDLRIGGHVGYYISPEYRGRGFGRQALLAAQQHLKNKCVFDALVTCEEDNLASLHVVESCGGKYWDTITNPENGKRVRRYWLQP